MAGNIAERRPPALLPIILDLHSIPLTDQQFYQLCQDNRDLRLEFTAQGKLVIMPPAGALTGWRNARITHRLAAWAESNRIGLSFDSSTSFKLPNGAKRSPDAAWIKRERWEALSEQQQFAPLCPDFVLELRSLDGDPAILQNKMAEYLENGARLGWLLDPKFKRVYVYRPGQPVKCLEDPYAVSGDPVLPGFVLNVTDIW